VANVERKGLSRETTLLKGGKYDSYSKKTSQFNELATKGEELFQFLEESAKEYRKGGETAYWFKKREE